MMDNPSIAGEITDCLKRHRHYDWRNIQKDNKKTKRETLRTKNKLIFSHVSEDKAHESSLIPNGRPQRCSCQKNTET